MTALPPTTPITVYKKVRSSNDAGIDVPHIDEYIANNDTGYEGIFGAVRPYFDFDLKYDTLEEQQASADGLLDKVQKEIRRIYPTGTLAVSTANGLKSDGSFVNSFHVVVSGDTPVYADGASFLSYISEQWQSEIEFDRNVYAKAGKRQLFRLVGCSKEGENRPFIKLDPEQDTSEFIVSATHCKPEATTRKPESSQNDESSYCGVFRDRPEKTDDTYWKRFIELQPMYEREAAFGRSVAESEITTSINTKRLCSSHCDICNRSHDNDNTLYVIVLPKHNKIMRGCTRLKSVLKFVGAIDDEKPIIDTVVVRTPISKALKATCRDLQRPFKASNGVGNCASVCTTRVKYISDDPRIMADKSEIVCVRGHMGIGKSYATHSKIKDMLATKPDARIILNTFRTSLASDFKRKYADLGFVCYSDVEGAIKAPKLIIQQDSYNRINLKGGVPDLFVIDEIDQVQKHMTSKTYLGQRDTRASNWAKFMWCVRYARQVLIMSAGATTRNIEWLSKMRWGAQDYENTMTKHVKIYHNKYDDVSKKRKILLTPNKFNVIRRARKDLSQKKRIYIAHNGSKERIHALAAFLLETLTARKLKVLTVCSDTLHKAEVKAALADANGEFGKYDCIICSSSIQSGISYDPVNSFDRVYGMFENWTNLSSDCVQMLHRIRHPIDKSMLIYVSKTNHMPAREGNKFDDFGYQAKYIYDATDRENLGSMCGQQYDESGACIILNSDYMKLYVDNKTEEEKDRLSFVKRLVHYLRDEGHTEIEECITVDGENKNRCKVMSKLTKKYIVAIKLGLFKGMCAELAEALEITSEADEKIVAKMKVAKHTDKDKLEHTKFTLAREYHLPTVPKSADWYETYNKKPIRKHFKNQRKICWYPNLKKSLERVKQNEMANHENFRENEAKAGRGKNATAAAMNAVSQTYDFKRWEHLFEMLEMIGIDSFHDAPQIEPADMIEGLDAVRKKWLANTFNRGRTLNVLGKKKDANLDGMLKMKTTEPGFVMNMLKFINGTLRSEFGVSVKRVRIAKHKGDDMKIPYELFNPYLKKGLFKNTLVVQQPAELKFGIETPAFGGNRDVADAALQDMVDDFIPPVSEEEFQKALKDLDINDIV
jgi:hypothetical protein